MTHFIGTRKCFSTEELDAAGVSYTDHHYWDGTGLHYVIMKIVDGRQVYTLIGGQEITKVHSHTLCAGENCTIHNQSDHGMAQWPMNFRPDRGIMERLCPHGIGHPDPDDPTLDTTHGCDGCCFKED